MSQQSDVLNERIRQMTQEDAAFHPPPFFGWFWRDVDWDAPNVWLACSPVRAPSWWGSTAEAVILGEKWRGGEVRFCENNKWDYPMFAVTGAAWVELRRLITEYVNAPTNDGYDALVAFMNGTATPEALAAEI